MGAGGPGIVGLGGPGATIAGGGVGDAELKEPDSGARAPGRGITVGRAASGRSPAVGIGWRGPESGAPAITCPGLGDVGTGRAGTTPGRAIGGTSGDTGRAGPRCGIPPAIGGRKGAE